jgi:hypothetical protein
MQTNGGIIRRLNRVYFIIFLLFLFSGPLNLVCQTKTLSCADLKTGIFYYYPKNVSGRFIDVRDNEFLHEKSMDNEDSGLSKIKWINDCSYSLKYIRGNAKLPVETLQFLKSHDLVYEIINITENYYTFKGYVDKTSNPAFLTDTMWFSEKLNYTSNELFKKLPNAAILKKNHFSDTSKYAVVYIYRPGKFTNSLGDYPVYFDNAAMLVAKNNSGSIYKILKEGKFEIKSKLLKDESSVKLDVKFGRTYYVKSMIHWGITSRLYNFRLEMAIVSPEHGQAEFENVNLQ